jgi:acyl carrier protein
MRSGVELREAEVREKLRAYIARDLIRDPGYALTDAEGIISGGLMDSFALAELAVYIEGELGVYIPDPDLTVAKMDTLDQMVARVMRGL